MVTCWNVLPGPSCLTRIRVRTTDANSSGERGTSHPFTDKERGREAQDHVLGHCQLKPCGCGHRASPPSRLAQVADPGPALPRPGGTRPAAERQATALGQCRGTYFQVRGALKTLKTRPKQRAARKSPATAAGLFGAPRAAWDALGLVLGPIFTQGRRTHPFSNKNSCLCPFAPGVSRRAARAEPLCPSGQVMEAGGGQLPRSWTQVIFVTEQRGAET